jgi:(2Fe-2S) ferredoxin
MGRVQNLQLTNVSVVTTGCMGFCNAGPLMVVYPEGVWYQPQSIADIDRIVEEHFVRGELVEELVVILKR